MSNINVETCLYKSCLEKVASNLDVRYSSEMTGSNLGWPLSPGKGSTRVLQSGSRKNAIDCRDFCRAESSSGILTLKWKQKRLSLVAITAVVRWLSLNINLCMFIRTVFVNTARQAFARADKTILLYIIVGVNQLSCEPETLKLINCCTYFAVVYKLFGETYQLT